MGTEHYHTSRDLVLVQALSNNLHAIHPSQIPVLQHKCSRIRRQCIYPTQPKQQTNPTQPIQPNPSNQATKQQPNHTNATQHNQPTSHPPNFIQLSTFKIRKFQAADLRNIPYKYVPQITHIHNMKQK